jgi:hypothetical protein
MLSSYRVLDLTDERGQLAGYAEAADLEALGALVDEHVDGAITRREDAGLRATRHLYIARA